MRVIRGVVRAQVSTIVLVAGLSSIGSMPAAGADAEIALPGAAPPVAKVRDSRFGFLDLNGDGYISRDEVPRDDLVLRSQFSALDRDDDGRLDIEEYVVTRR